MSAAPNADDMQATQQLNKNAGTAEQNLPGLTMTAELPPLPLDRNGKLRVADADTAVSSTDAAAFLGLASQSAGSDFPTHDAAATLPATVRHLVGDSIIAMKQTGLDSVSVTLKPDNDTQLALHLKMQHGRLEALAVVERGDLTVLGAEWSHLQSRLAEQGVRLAPLISSADHSSWFSNKNFSSPQQGHREMPFQDLPFQMMAKPGARKAGARIANPANGSEWWA